MFGQPRRIVQETAPNERCLEVGVFERRVLCDDLGFGFASLNPVEQVVEANARIPNDKLMLVIESDSAHTHFGQTGNVLRVAKDR
jgi:hypothetical protein